MKRLLPLLFLLPSVALILYAKRDGERDATSYEVRVLVETGGFEFPGDVRLFVMSWDSLAAGSWIEEGSATVQVTQSGPVTLRISGFQFPDGVSGATGVLVGEPQTFEPRPEAETPTWTLAFTPAECREALAAMRESR